MVQRSDSSPNVSVRFSGNSIEDCRRNLEVVKGQASEAKVLSKAEWALREAIQAKAFQCLVARTKDIGVAYDLSHSVAEKVFAKRVAGAVGPGCEFMGPGPWILESPPRELPCFSGSYRFFPFFLMGMSDDYFFGVLRSPSTRKSLVPGRFPGFSEE